METNKKFQDLYVEHFKSVYRFAFFKLNNKEQAEDITAETFTKLYENLQKEEIRYPKTWLITVARNMIFNKYKKKETEPLVNEEGDYPEIEDSVGKIEDEVLREELSSLLQKYLDKLDESTKEVVVLRVWEEMQFSEIAKITNLKEVTAKQKFYRGVEQLKLDVNSSNNTKLRSVTLPILLGGIYAIATQAKYLSSTSFVNELSKSLLSSNYINITNKIMESTMQTSSVGSVASTGIFSQIVATTAGKAILGLTVATVAGVSGLGIYTVANPNSNSSEQQGTQEQAQNQRENDSAYVKYKNQNFPEFSFEYLSSEWELTESDKGSEGITLKLIKDDKELEFLLTSSSTFDYGTQVDCYDYEYSFVTDEFAIINKENKYSYVNNLLEIGSDKYNEVTQYAVPQNIVENPSICQLPNVITTKAANVNADGVLEKFGLVKISTNVFNDSDVNTIIKTLNLQDKDLGFISDECIGVFKMAREVYDKCKWTAEKRRAYTNENVLKNEEGNLIIELYHREVRLGMFECNGKSYEKVYGDISRFNIGENEYNYGVLLEGYKSKNENYYCYDKALSWRDIELDFYITKPLITYTGTNTEDADNVIRSMGILHEQKRYNASLTGVFAEDAKAFVKDILNKLMDNPDFDVIDYINSFQNHRQ